MDYFISIYFNYFEFKRRYNLTKQFIDAYPQVILIEIAYGCDKFKFNGPNVLHYREEQAGWVTNKYINKFVEEHRDANSITFMDADIIVPYDFFTKVKNRMNGENKCLFVQPYTTLRRQYSNEKVYSQLSDIGKEGHTGMIYTYSNKFINLIRFPECLVLGGFDTVLYQALLKQDRNFDGLCNVVGKKVSQELVVFYQLVKNLCSYDHINQEIYSYYDGNNKQYKERFFLYPKLNQEIIDKYFESRNEDD